MVSPGSVSEEGICPVSLLLRPFAIMAPFLRSHAQEVALKCCLCSFAAFPRAGWDVQHPSGAPWPLSTLP